MNVGDPQCRAPLVSKAPLLRVTVLGGWLCEAARLSWLTVTSGAVTVEPSRLLLRTYAGVMTVLGVGFAARSLMSASCCKKLESVTRRPGVLCTEASLPASVLMLKWVLSTLRAGEATAPCIPLMVMASVSARMRDATIFIIGCRLAFRI